MSNGCRLESSLPVAMTKWFVQQAQFLLQKNNNNKFLPKGDRDEMQAVYALFCLFPQNKKKKTLLGSNVRKKSEMFTSFKQPMKLLLTGDPGRSAVLGLPPT